MSEIINKYTTPKEPASFSGLNSFIKNHPKFNKKNVFKVLNKLNVYTQHKPIKYIFKRNKVLVGGIDDIWQADLIDVKNIKNYNYNIKYILTCIDVFSKYGWVIKLKSKTAKDVLEAFKIIFKDKRTPRALHVDGKNIFFINIKCIILKIFTSKGGNEFKGVCRDYLVNEKKIKIYITNSKLKAVNVERFNSTIKSKMYRMFTFKKSLKTARNKYKNFTSNLQDLIDSYNRTYHRSIKEKPINVNKENELKIFKNLYGYERSQGDDTYIKFSFKKGDFVRKRINKELFSKGYTPNYTDEIFIVEQLLPRVPPVYKIKSIQNEIEENIYYKEELIKVESIDFPFEVFEIEKNGNNYIVNHLNSKNDEEKKITINNREKLIELLN